MYKHIFKRFIDLVLSTLGIIILIPVWILLALAIVVDDPGPVVFKQKRIGKDKNGSIQYFTILKYRTMNTSTPHDTPTHLLDNVAQYITRVGSFLRKTSLDELPQMFNIWVGQMSIIGPRPALWNQEDLYMERAKYGANAVTPGLTGWAQVNGRDEIEIAAKARYDGDYCKHITFKMDAICFFMTIRNVLTSRGVVEGGTGVIVKHMDKRQAEVDGVTTNEASLK